MICLDSQKAPKARTSKNGTKTSFGVNYLLGGMHNYANA